MITMTLELISALFAILHCSGLAMIVGIFFMDFLTCLWISYEHVSSDTKYDSGSGWPSFYKTLPCEEDKETVERRPDNSIEERPRVEVVCNKVSV